MSVLFNIFLVVLGHFAVAFAVYFTHRFIYHGKLGDLFIFRNVKEYHRLHHLYSEHWKGDLYVSSPFLSRFCFYISYLLVFFLVSKPFAIGMLTFSLYYVINHYKIHKAQHELHSYWHHTRHHKNQKKNFSGMWPFFDRLFGSYEEARPWKR